MVGRGLAILKFKHGQAWNGGGAVSQFIHSNSGKQGIAIAEEIARLKQAAR